MWTYQSITSPKEMIGSACTISWLARLVVSMQGYGLRDYSQHARVWVARLQSACKGAWIMVSNSQQRNASTMHHSVSQQTMRRSSIHVAFAQSSSEQCVDAYVVSRARLSRGGVWPARLLMISCVGGVACLNKLSLFTKIDQNGVRWEKFSQGACEAFRLQIHKRTDCKCLA